MDDRRGAFGGAGLLAERDALGLDRVGTLADAMRAEGHVEGVEGRTSSRLWRRVEASAKEATDACKRALGKRASASEGEGERGDEEEGEGEGFRDAYVDAFLRGFEGDLEALQREEGEVDPSLIVAMLEEGATLYSSVERRLWIGTEESRPCQSTRLFG